MTDAHPQNLVLSIYPFSRGFAFVFFEGPESPFDWGVKEIKEKHKNTKTLDEIKKLIDRYRPEVLVIEDTSDKALAPHLAHPQALPDARAPGGG